VLRVVAARLGNAADAREVAQEVFLAAYTKLAQLRQPEFFPRWLSRIAERRALNRAVRRRYVVTAGSEVLDGRVDSGPTPFETALREERAGQVWDGLSRLRAMDRQALTAFYIDGRSLNQISDELDVPLGTVKRRLHVARKRLRSELEQLV
jgi:RNA polymerase sigma-70 factor (ECF subfamily)